MFLEALCNWNLDTEWLQCRVVGLASCICGLGSLNIPLLWLFSVRLFSFSKGTSKMCEPEYRDQYSGTSNLTIPMENFILSICLFWASPLLSRDSLFHFFFRKRTPLAKAITTVNGGAVDTISFIGSSISSQPFVVSSILQLARDPGGQQANVSLCRHFFWSANSLPFPPYTFFLHMLWSRQHTSWFHHQIDFVFLSFLLFGGNATQEEKGIHCQF